MTALHSTCPGPDVIEAVATGGSASPEISRHLAKCPACAAALESARFANRFAAVLEGNAPPERPAEALPEVFGYEVFGELSRGGQAVVYHGVQLRTGQPVAIKVLHWSANQSRSARARFAREIEIAGALNHPGIVHPIDSLTLADGREALILEMVDGRGLGAWLHEDPRPGTPEIVAVLAQVAEALHHAHQRGVIHRDLKPSNILIDTTGRPRVLDFGVARWADSPSGPSGRATGGRITLTGEFAGTLAYAAPEQVSGSSRRTDTRSDTYALGVIAYEALTGKLPYPVDGSLEKTIHSILHADPPRPTALGADLSAVVLKAIAKAPERRYQIAGDLARDLRRALAGETIEARRESRMYVLRKTVHRHRFVVTVAVMVFIAAIAILAVLAISNRRLSGELFERTLGQLKALGATGSRAKAEAILWPEIDAAIPPGSPSASAGLWTGALNQRRVLWALAELQAQAQCLATVALAGGEKYSAYLADGRIGLVYADGTLATCDPASGQVRPLAARLSAGRFDAGFTPSGRRVVTNRGDALICYDAVSGREEARVQIAGSDGQRVGLRVNENFIAAAEGESGVGVYSLPALKRVGGITGSLKHYRPWTDAAGRTLVWMDQARRVHVTDLTGAAPDRIIPIIADPPESGPAELVDYAMLDVDAKASTAIVGFSNSTQVVPLDGSRPPFTLPGSPRYRVVPSLSPDGRLLSVATNGISRLRLWDTATWSELTPLPGHDRVVGSHGVSIDGRTLYTIDAGGVMRVWSAPGSGWRRTLTAPTVYALDLALSRDSQRLYTADGTGLLSCVPVDGGPPIWSAPFATQTVAVNPAEDLAAVASGGSAITLIRPRATAPTRTLDLGQGRRAQQVRFSPDGRTLAACTVEGTLSLFDVATGAVRTTFQPPGTSAGPPTDSFSALRFSPDGSRVVLSRRDGSVWALDIDQPSAARRIPVSSRMLRALDLDPTGRRAAAVGNSGELAVIDLESGSARLSPRISEDDLMAVAFHPSGRTVAAADRSGSVTFIDAETLDVLAALPVGASVTSLHWDAKGDALFVAALGRPIERWDLSSLVAPLERIRPRVKDAAPPR